MKEKRVLRNTKTTKKTSCEASQNINFGPEKENILLATQNDNRGLKPNPIPGLSVQCLFCGNGKDASRWRNENFWNDHKTVFECQRFGTTLGGNSGGFRPNCFLCIKAQNGQGRFNEIDFSHLNIANCFKQNFLIPKEICATTSTETRDDIKVALKERGNNFSQLLKPSSQGSKIKEALLTNLGESISKTLKLSQEANSIVQHQIRSLNQEVSSKNRLNQKLITTNQHSQLTITQNPNLPLPKIIDTSPNNLNMFEGQNKVKQNLVEPATRLRTRMKPAKITSKFPNISTQVLQSITITEITQKNKNEIIILTNDKNVQKDHQEEEGTANEKFAKSSENETKSRMNKDQSNLQDPIKIANASESNIANLQSQNPNNVANDRTRQARGFRCSKCQMFLESPRALIHHFSQKHLDHPAPEKSGLPDISDSQVNTVFENNRIGFDSSVDNETNCKTSSGHQKIETETSNKSEPHADQNNLEKEKTEESQTKPDIDTSKSNTESNQFNSEMSQENKPTKGRQKTRQTKIESERRTNKANHSKISKMKIDSVKKKDLKVDNDVKIEKCVLLVPEFTNIQSKSSIVAKKQTEMDKDSSVNRNDGSKKVETKTENEARNILDDDGPAKVIEQLSSRTSDTDEHRDKVDPVKDLDCSRTRSQADIKKIKPKERSVPKKVRKARKKVENKKTIAEKVDEEMQDRQTDVQSKSSTKTLEPLQESVLSQTSVKDISKVAKKKSKRKSPEASTEVEKQEPKKMKSNSKNVIQRLDSQKVRHKNKNKRLAKEADQSQTEATENKQIKEGEEKKQVSKRQSREPRPCRYCSKMFIRLKSMETHILKMHLNENNEVMNNNEQPQELKSIETENDESEKFSAMPKEQPNIISENGAKCVSKRKSLEMGNGGFKQNSKKIKSHSFAEVSSQNSSSVIERPRRKSTLDKPQGKLSLAKNEVKSENSKVEAIITKKEIKKAKKKSKIEVIVSKKEDKEKSNDDEENSETNRAENKEERSTLEEEIANKKEAENSYREKRNEKEKSQTQPEEKNGDDTETEMKEETSSSVIQSSAFNCKTCEKGFSSEMLKREHWQIYHCEVKILVHTKLCCNMLTTEKEKSNQLISENTNININSKEENLACKDCNKTFTSSAKLKHHIKYVHSTTNSPVQCHICKKISKNKNYLKNHLNRVHFNKDVSCDICTSKFTDKYNLKYHLQKVHNINISKQLLDKHPKNQDQTFYTNGNSKENTQLNNKKGPEEDNKEEKIIENVFENLEVIDPPEISDEDLSFKVIEDLVNEGIGNRNPDHLISSLLFNFDFENIESELMDSFNNENSDETFNDQKDDHKAYESYYSMQNDESQSSSSTADQSSVELLYPESDTSFVDQPLVIKNVDEETEQLMETNHSSNANNSDSFFGGDQSSFTTGDDSMVDEDELNESVSILLANKHLLEILNDSDLMKFHQL